METIQEIIRIKQVITDVEVHNRIIRSPEDAAEIARDFIGDDDREVLFVMCLNTKNHVIAVHRAHIGALNASIAHPREIYKCAILNNAASIIISHQHPSQDPFQSQEDINVTKRVYEAGKIIGIELLDSLIVVGGSDKFTSMKEKGYLN